MALALSLMQITKTVHPPAGATALIAVVTPGIYAISWFYIGIVALSAAIQIAVACLVNNAERKYPQYWWTPHKPIKIDPATVSTVMPPLDTAERKEDVVSDNLTAAEEGRLQQNNNSSNGSLSSSLSTSASAVDHAIYTLQKHAHNSHTPYSLITPGSPLIVTPGLLSDSEQETLNALLQKMNTKLH
jgi:CBS-domain-containing membrane protein